MDELAYIKKLAGVNEFKGYTEYQQMKIPILQRQELKRKKRNQGLNLMIQIGLNYGQ